MRFSRHSLTRSQQRAVRLNVIDLILEFGMRRIKPGGAFELRLARRDIDRTIMHLKHSIGVLERAKKKAVLIDSESSLVITAYNLVGK